MESLVFIFAIMLGGALSLAPTCLVLSATALFIRNYYSLPYFKITVICLLLAMLTTAIISPELEGGIGSAMFLISLISFSWSVIFIPFIWFAKVYGKNKIAQIHEPSFDRKIINTNRLILLTAFISILGSLTLIDEDLSSVTTFSAGFIYSLVLAVCFEIKGKSRFFLGVVILTVGNVLSYFSNFPLIFLPKFIENITLLIPSVAGAILTFYVIKKLWRNGNFTFRH